MTAFYNEKDRYCAQWLRNLIDAGHIAPGVVDERSIEDITPNELREFTQCHFFAGIGVWSYALRLAGWPDDRPVWTGSCPCQPFSAAGKRAGFKDQRHLWPAWFHLIRECRPGVIFGEQVASLAGLGWLDLVQADLEGANFACGPIDICSASATDADIRQRLYWVADSSSEGLAQRTSFSGIQREEVCASTREAAFRSGTTGRVGHATRQRRGEEGAIGCGHSQRLADASSVGRLPATLGRINRPVEWVYCADGFHRPVEPSTFPLAHGIANRVGRLRAYGNAINAEVAATFISAYIECRMSVREAA